MCAQGTSTVIDTLYPKRIQHVKPMQMLGGKITTHDGIIRIDHSAELHGATITANDIRAGVALLGLALMADGTTVIEHADNILRGYDRIITKFRGLHVHIDVVNDTTGEE